MTGARFAQHREHLLRLRNLLERCTSLNEVTKDSFQARRRNWALIVKGPCFYEEGRSLRSD